MSSLSGMRFGESVSAYVAYRPEYPPELFERILAAVPLDRRIRAMDLGAGTGKSTRAVLNHFTEVIAVEPDSLMADRLRLGAPGAKVRVAAAEETVQEPSSVDLITIVTALHWMDAPRVMANVTLWLRTGGVLAVCGSVVPVTREPVRAAVGQEFEDHWNEFRDLRLNLVNSSQHVLQEIRALRVFDDRMVSNVVHLTAHEFAGFWRSSSYGSAYARSLADPESYWCDLESRLRQAWPEEKFAVDFRTWLVLATKD